MTKIIVFNLLTALFNFDDIVCGYDIFVDWNYWKIPIHPSEGVVWGRWKNFT